MPRVTNIFGQKHTTEKGNDMTVTMSTTARGAEEVREVLLARAGNKGLDDMEYFGVVADIWEGGSEVVEFFGPETHHATTGEARFVLAPMLRELSRELADGTAEEEHQVAVAFSRAHPYLCTIRVANNDHIERDLETAFDKSVEHMYAEDYGARWVPDPTKPCPDVEVVAQTDHFGKIVWHENLSDEAKRQATDTIETIVASARGSMRGSAKRVSERYGCTALAGLAVDSRQPRSCATLSGFHSGYTGDLDVRNDVAEFVDEYLWGRDGAYRTVIAFGFENEGVIVARVKSEVFEDDLHVDFAKTCHNLLGTRAMTTDTYEIRREAFKMPREKID